MFEGGAPRKDCRHSPSCFRALNRYSRIFNESGEQEMKTRKRWLIVIAAASLLTTLIVLPRIIGAKQSTGSPEKSLAVAPVPMRNTSQDQKSNVIVGASVHNDTSPPLRDIKQSKV